MKAVIGHLIVVLLLTVAGGVCWVLGGAERTVAQAHEALATMRYATVADTAGDLEQSLRWVAPVPSIAGGMNSTIHEDRSTAEYWLAQYDALAPQHDASGAVVERDPEVLFVAANAAYRALDVDVADRQALVRSLDGIIKSYAEVLKNGAGYEDAAYNYEFLTRQRDAAARGRTLVGSSATGLLASTTGGQPSIHGHEGAPPKDVDMSSFKIVIPKRTDERQEELKQGTGEAKGRKG